MSDVKRVFVEKKSGFDVEAKSLLNDLKENLSVNLTGLRILYRYDVENLEEEIFRKALTTVFSEPPVDDVYENFNFCDFKYSFGIEYLPGQYDQRADSAAQCIQLLTQGIRPVVKAAKIILLEGDITEDDFKKIKNYCINPVDSREAYMTLPETLTESYPEPEKVETIDNFIELDENGLKEFLKNYSLAMDLDDLIFCQIYFKNEEKRNPTITEIRILDTYWSDHCRHTTFLTEIERVNFGEGKTVEKIKDVYNQYLSDRNIVYGKREKPVSLMDIATLAMKKLRNEGKLYQLDESEEVNACSINIDVKIDDKTEKWLLMFKNETHNHPTEIEPFGGAATCLGGAIRDPLSGRSYVFQAMRVTGSGDPRKSVEETLEGKLPQRKITTEAAHGYSSYGNQIGLATGLVDEIYHDGYVAKRMEIGAVVAAAPKENVVRKEPEPGDLVVLLGGKTGRDGCGGATGSSKAHDEESIVSCGAEVQKGNPPEERKIQRLFRKPEVTKMIKRCNDFGAGGVSVAIGELADGLDINLDAVPKKYKGLDGTEIAISESQERMAVVINAEDEEQFINEALKENLEATTVAVVKKEPRVRMYWHGNKIVDISREFLNSNGAPKRTYIEVENKHADVEKPAINITGDFTKDVKSVLQDLNVASKKGLIERFDSTIGKGTVFMPFGGKYQLTPSDVMAAKIPVLEGDTSTVSVMSYGYDYILAEQSQFHSAVYSVVESVAKLVAAGVNYNNIYLTLQEYFEKLGNDPKRWSKPFEALLGAYYAQSKLEIAAIGGKDSMSGSFKDLDVPPTLVSFAINTVEADKIVSNELKSTDSKLVLLPIKLDENMLPEFDYLKKLFELVNHLANEGKILSSSIVKRFGIIETLLKMSFGNKIGIQLNDSVKYDELFKPNRGAFILELSKEIDLEKELKGFEYRELGGTIKEEKIIFNSSEITIDKALEIWCAPLEKVFPTNVNHIDKAIPDYSYSKSGALKGKVKVAKPRVLIPVFPGTNCEYDTARAFEEAGALSEVFVFRNLTSGLINDSIEKMTSLIKNSQIIMLPGGFSAGDEPEGSGKFIANIFRNPKISDAVTELLEERDGLILGICNGFQALIKLGLLPYGKISEIKKDSPTLTFNDIGRHVSKLVNTKIVSKLSPWLQDCELDEINTIAVSHGEGKFVANDDVINELMANGQIATQYVDLNGKPTYDIEYNPNGSIMAIEGITSKDGRIFGKMGHTERYGKNIFKNVPGKKEQKIFTSGVKYFL